MKRLLILLLLMISNLAISQENNLVSRDTTREAIKPIPVGEISGNVGEVNSIIKRFNDKLIFDNRIQRIDSLMPQAERYLNDLKTKYLAGDVELSLRRIDNLIMEWHTYQGELKQRLITVNSRLQELELLLTEIRPIVNQWELTAANAKDLGAPEEIINIVDTLLKRLESTIRDAKQRFNYLVLVQSRLTEMDLLISEMISSFEGQKLVIQKDIFKIDASPIWNVSDSSIFNRNSYSTIGQELGDSYQLTKLYLSTYRHILFFQVIFLILIVILLKLLETKRKNEYPGIFFGWPILSALQIGLLISVLFYPYQPLFLVSIFVILSLVIAVFLLKRISHSKSSIFYYLVVVIFILNVVQNFMVVWSLTNRFTLILIHLSLLATIIYYYYKRKEIAIFNGVLSRRTINILSIIFVIIISLSLILNVIGNVALSTLLTTGTVKAFAFGIILIAAARIIKDLLTGLISKSKQYKLSFFSQLDKLLVNRIAPQLDWIMFFSWFVLASMAFGFFEPIKEIFQGLIQIKWHVGVTTISLGGIFGFIAILFVTYLLSKAIGAILKDDWVIARTPRGIANAVSMLLRYVIVGFGLFLALSAAGVDLSKFGLIAGALGLGIGFGLQNIVFNFISGLVLAFERPIHVGDTVEVGTLMGVVTEIGVRASKVKTFDGSEVIVPNGNLISNQVINWTLSDQQRRLMISIQTALGSDPKEVTKILLDQASKHPNTLKEPPPMALFNGYVNSTLDFTLYFWVYFNVGLKTKSEVALSIHDALLKEGIDMPVPKQRILIHKEEENEDSETKS